MSKYLSHYKKPLMYYLHKRDKDQTMKEYKIKINDREYKKLCFPEIEDTTPKEVILELVTKFRYAITDCKIFITPITNKIEAQIVEQRKAEKNVYHLSKGYLNGNLVEKQ